MDDNYIKLQAKEDFHKQHLKGLLSGLLPLIASREHNRLLSYYNIRDLLRDKRESYLGLKVVPVEKIIGSESRYQDFTRSFLPKAKHLQDRWVNISMAAQKDIILPPIQLFQIGDAYFVRDGNHRVSVAKSSGIEMIDAEVTQVVSEIYISADMTHKEVVQRVIEYEQKMIFKETRLANYIDTTQLRVTAPGSYTLLIQHIMGHKHFVEQERRVEKQAQQGGAEDARDADELQQIQALNPVLAGLDREAMSFAEAAQSWYEKLFAPICQLILQQKLLHWFSERTPADLYIWLVSYWQDLKQQYGEDVELERAVIDYSQQIKASTAQGKRFGRRSRVSAP